MPFTNFTPQDDADSAYADCYTFVRNEDGFAASIHVFGEVDLSAASELETALETASASGKGVILDLTACSYFDSSTIAIMVRAMKRWGERFAIVVPPAHRTRRILQLCNLESTLPIETSVASATARVSVATIVERG
jgi:anti-anti-sigma factor